jgi:hypothetical protein
LRDRGNERRRACSYYFPCNYGSDGAARQGGGDRETRGKVDGKVRQLRGAAPHDNLVLVIAIVEREACLLIAIAPPFLLLNA